MYDATDWTDEHAAALEDGLDRARLGTRIRALAGQWRELLSRGEIVRAAPHAAERTWSILEHGCHVRAALEYTEQHLRLMLKKRKPPKLRYWNQRDAAVDGKYGQQDPGKVAYALASTGGKVADLLDRIDDGDWQRTAVRLDGAEFTVERLARYLVHDLEHHLDQAHQILDGR